MSDPTPISREVFLRENGWRETPRGWVKEGGFGKPLPADSAFELQTILDALNDEIAEEMRCDSGRLPKGEDPKRSEGAECEASQSGGGVGIADGIASPSPSPPNPPDTLIR